LKSVHFIPASAGIFLASPAQPDRALVLRIEPPGHRCPGVSTLSGADR